MKQRSLTDTKHSYSAPRSTLIRLPTATPLDPFNKPKGPSPHYSLYQREMFKLGGESGICMPLSLYREFCGPLTYRKQCRVSLFTRRSSRSRPRRSLTTADTSTPTLTRALAGPIGRTGTRLVRASGEIYARVHPTLFNREAFYRWRIIPRTCVDTGTRDLTSKFPYFCCSLTVDWKVCSDHFWAQDPRPYHVCTDRHQQTLLGSG